MKVAYLVHFRGGRETGILRKVTSQVEAWSRRGVDVGLFVATDEAGLDHWRSLPQAISVRGMSSRRSILFEREKLAVSLISWKPDAVYVRQTLAYPGLVRIVRTYPTFFEINTDDLAEFRTVSKRREVLARLSRGVLLSRAAGMVFVTEELRSNPRFASYGRPAVVVPNGFDLASCEPTTAPNNVTPRLVFVGHPGVPWHGLDLLEELAAARPNWEFNVIGPSPHELRLGLRNIAVHGLLQPDEYRSILASADIAIGTLALFRKHMSEASPLKVREYLAAGLPTIIGYRDTDFPDGAPFLLQIPNRDKGVGESIYRVEQFVQSWLGRRVPRSSIAHLDTKVKEAARLAFLERCTSRIPT